MAGTPTPRLGLHGPTGPDSARIPYDLDILRGQLDEAAIYRESVIGTRPAANTVPAGTIFRATDLDRIYLSTGTVWIELGGEPVGTITAFAGSSAPAGRLLCDGAAVSRTTYADLFAAISTSFGSGNGSTTFNLPDLRGRVPVGVDGAANRLDSNDALGQSSGAQKHTLAAGELPAHSHPLGGWMPRSTNLGWTWIGAATDILGPIVASNTGPGTISPAQNTNNNTPSDSPHNNMQPYQIVNYLIKT